MVRCIWAQDNTKRHPWTTPKKAVFATMGVYTLSIFVTENGLLCRIFRDDPLSVYTLPEAIGLKATLKEAQFILEAEALKMIIAER